MANETKSTSVASTLIPRIIEDATFVAEQAIYMPMLVTAYGDRTGLEPRREGIYPQATASEVAEGAEVGTYVEITESANMVLTPKIAQIEVFITDEAVEGNKGNLREDNARILGLGITRKVDADQVGVFTSLTASKGNGGSALTITNVAAAIAVLRDNNTPNPMNVVLHPYQWHNIWTLLGAPAANQTFLGDVANQAMRDYYSGRFLNVDWYTNSNIATVGTASGGTVTGAVFHKEAMALDIRKRLTFETERDAKKRSDIVVANIKYAVGIRKAVHGVKLLAYGTEPT